MAPVPSLHGEARPIPDMLRAHRIRTGALAPPPSPPPVVLTPAPRRDAPFRGIGLILLSTVFLTAGDVASKYLASSVPALQIVWLRYVVFAGIMLAVALPAGRARIASRRPGLQVLRAFAVTISSIIFVSSLRYLPIADATATSFVTPVFVTALAIFMLGEKVGWRRWTATIVGLVGVVIVVRPGGSGFQAASVLPVLSAFSWAFSLIITRMMSTTENPITTLTWSAVIGAVMISALLPLVWQPLTTEAIAIGVLIGVISTVGHWLVILAFRHADASLLAPFSYVQLLWATLMGFWLFAVLPDMFTLIGAAIITGSGLYTAHRERIRARDVNRR